MEMDRTSRRALLRIRVLVGKGFYRYTQSSDDGREEHGISDDDVREIVAVASVITLQENGHWRIEGVDIGDRPVRLVIELLENDVVFISVHLILKKDPE